MTREELKERLAYVEKRLKYWRNNRSLGYDRLICTPTINALVKQKKEIKLCLTQKK